MKFPRYIALTAFLLFPLQAEEEPQDLLSVMEKHAAGSEKLADEQDELSADVQQLIIEQTIPQVIELLSEVEAIMGETTDYLADMNTGGATIAAQTEIVEKIHAAAKARQQQGQGQGDAGSAMMDMMERMMGQKEGKGEGEGEEGEKPGDKPGQGQTGDSNTANTENGGNSGGKIQERTVPKAGGKAGRGLPSEFQQALDAYNRGLEGKSK